MIVSLNSAVWRVGATGPLSSVKSTSRWINSTVNRWCNAVTPEDTRTTKTTDWKSLRLFCFSLSECVWVCFLIYKPVAPSKLQRGGRQQASVHTAGLLRHKHTHQHTHQQNYQSNPVPLFDRANLTGWAWEHVCDDTNNNYTGPDMWSSPPVLCHQLHVV